MSGIGGFLSETKWYYCHPLAGISAGIGTYLIGVNWGAIAGVVKVAMKGIGTAISGISLHCSYRGINSLICRSISPPMAKPMKNLEQCS